MQVERFVRTLALFLVLGLAGYSGGCGSGSRSAADLTAAGEAIKKDRGALHKQLKADAKKIQKIQAEGQKVQAAARKGGHRGQGGP
jgi:uncharacterized membrane protein